jgi:two-component system OmpR family response regulator
MKGGKMRVLLVEDDPMIGSAVQDARREARYAVDWVRDGQAALDASSSQQYDLVLLDLGLPRVAGLEVLDGLRRKGKQVPVVILTARDATEDAPGS